MTISVLTLAGAVLSFLGTVGYAGWKYLAVRRAVENSPAMQANALAGQDTQIEEAAKSAVAKADAGDLTDEQRMEAQ